MTQDTVLPSITQPTGPSAAPLRLRLDPAPSREGVLDGAWWPHSRDPSAELPDLIAGLGSRLGVITRVALNIDAWDSAPRRLVAGGRAVHVGWFRTMDAHTISVTRNRQDRFVLLVIPPEATTAAAATAMAMAAKRKISTRPADILAASGIVVAEEVPHAR
jgi:hypothetical protein